MVFKDPPAALYYAITEEALIALSPPEKPPHLLSNKEILQWWESAIPQVREMLDKLEMRHPDWKEAIEETRNGLGIYKQYFRD